MSWSSRCPTRRRRTRSVSTPRRSTGGSSSTSRTRSTSASSSRSTPRPSAPGPSVIADVAPDGARVVKAFNTTFAGTLLAGAVDGRPLDVFLAGDDEDAKATVAALARDGGLRPIDAGRLARARELEALGYLHMAVQPALGTAFGSAVAIVP